MHTEQEEYPVINTHAIFCRGGVAPPAGFPYFSVITVGKNNRKMDNGDIK